ncbi:two-component system KDP operon response regulator KdpE [Fluviicoccus keumensis]|uniref:Two-component system KDP operon response regulator KdpE n=1 Tax=Fluviicoccus keumensis TaxID=1435465 RepID=A0A4Q7Z5F6_9GAMM|nr:two-component system response regulator KdpE [Fluviicoccus keumensis]RZU45061.1 two-component system KDP operon response regulator KdpE [Fluviicoccus keumensis]
MTDHAPLILIVEDERQIRRFIRSALESEGCAVRENDRGRPGLLDAVAVKPDLVLLDLGLPDIDGVEFIRDLRSWSSAPVIVVSARSDEREKILALDAGADDYLTKPFGVGELLARVRALLRRRNAAHNSPIMQFGEVTVDLARRQVSRANAEVHLTPIEYRLLTTLLASDGKVLTHRHLLREVWGSAYVESNHYLRIYMGHLRQKLEPDPARPRHFLTETGIGYRFQP